MSVLNFIKASADTEYFSLRNMIPNTTLAPDDSPEVKAGKLRERLRNLDKIRSLMADGRWKLLESMLMYDVFRLDNEIPGAYLRKDEQQLQDMVVRRTGIVALFEAVEGVSEQIRLTQAEINQIEAKTTPEDEIDKELHV